MGEKQLKHLGWEASPLSEGAVTLAVSLESALKNSKQAGHPDAHWQQSIGKSSLGTCQAFC